MTDELMNWRKQIDALDKELVEIMAKRMEVVRKIGKYKKSKNLPPLDEKRWKEVLESRLSLAGLFKLPKSLIENIYTIIHEYALKIEEEEK